jgi:N6-L-threonylcarbamoyladenine synthase
MKILAIETSCDETAAAVVDDRRDSGPPPLNETAKGWVCSSVVASQDEIHAPFGGVIPELASRRHVEVLPQVVSEALRRARVSLGDLQGIAVTHCPGLMGALLVGLSYAKALAYASGLPLIGVNHLAGHLASVLLDGHRITWPHLGLVVSGGHTSLYLGQVEERYCLLGSTQDDAAGEAFDKIAKLLNLGYPGGREVEQKAKSFSCAERDAPPSFSFPRTRLKKGGYGYSFSGLKTAVAQYLRQNPQFDVGQVAYVFQESVLQILAEPLTRAIAEFRPRSVLFCGGVAANQRLRQGLCALCEQSGVDFVVPEMQWCTDNAAMIGAAGILKLRAGIIDDLSLTASPQSIHNPEELLQDFFPGKRDFERFQ